MAQKEIVLMQNKNGKQRDLPNGELGQLLFTTDEGRAFLGLPSSAEPASLVAGRTQATDPNRGNENVEILTEFTPWSIINDTINRPQTVTVTANSTVNFAIQGASRMFMKYVAYNTDATILESGEVQVLAINASTIISQQNNTSESEGVTQIDFNTPSFNSSTSRLNLNATNSSSTDFTIEFVISGWNE